MTQFFLHSKDVFTDFPNNAITKSPQTIGTSPNTSPLPAGIPDEPLRLGSRPSWVSTVLSRVLTLAKCFDLPHESLVHQPSVTVFPADHTNSSEYYDHLPPVLDPGVIFQVCIHVRAQCCETLTSDLARALRCLTGQDNDGTYLKHGLQVTRYTNGHFKLVLQVLQHCCQSHSFNPHIKGEEDITQRDTAY